MTVTSAEVWEAILGWAWVFARTLFLTLLVYGVLVWVGDRIDIGIGKDEDDP
jgi:hypothetical protein